MIPSREQCFKLIEKYHVPKNIVKHSLTVNKVATYLAKQLIAKGEKVNYELVDRASLLHDIAKHMKGDNHEEEGYKILKNEGLKEVALIVRKHSLFSVLSEKDKPVTWEEKIVFYADKRVIEDYIVGLEERMNYLKKRYGKSQEILRKIEESKLLTRKIEKEIFCKIGDSPSSLNRLM